MKFRGSGPIHPRFTDSPLEFNPYDLARDEAWESDSLTDLADFTDLFGKLLETFERTLQGYN